MTFTTHAALYLSCFDRVSACYVASRCVTQWQSATVKQEVDDVVIAC